MGQAGSGRDPGPEQPRQCQPDQADQHAGQADDGD
jgi:hypothetical protein